MVEVGVLIEELGYEVECCSYIDATKQEPRILLIGT